MFLIISRPTGNYKYASLRFLHYCTKYSWWVNQLLNKSPRVYCLGVHFLITIFLTKLGKMVIKNCTYNKFSVVMFLLLSGLTMFRAAEAVSMNYYIMRCPMVELIVRDTVNRALQFDPTLAAGLIRMHFHDCFIQVHFFYLFRDFVLLCCTYYVLSLIFCLWNRDVMLRFYWIQRRGIQQRRILQQIWVWGVMRLLMILKISLKINVLEWFLVLI